MIIGIPREIKSFENRVGLIPVYVKQLVKEKHKVLVQTKAGLRSGISDDAYLDAGAEIVSSLNDIYQNSELIVKVKEPQERELSLIQEKQLLFSFFHLSSSRQLLEGLLKTKCIALTYETLETEENKRPVLTPMSSIAGKLSIQVGMSQLENIITGKGVLLGGVPGVSAGNVVILGAGVVGTNACYVASHIRANVTVLDINLDRLGALQNIMPNNVQFLFSNEENLMNVLKKADLVISAVHLTGRKAPVLIKRENLSLMEENSVIIDVAIDQGGGVETSSPTTHLEPTFKVDGIVHYCVSNIPSIVPKTATYILSHASFPYIQTIAKIGIKKALHDNYALRSGLNLWAGEITNKNVAETFQMECRKLDELIE